MSGRGRLRAGMVLVGLVALGLMGGGIGSLRAAPVPSRGQRTFATTAACATSGSSSTLWAFSSGEKLLSDTSIPVCATGEVTVSFSGDPATGCAAQGLCGYVGSESWQPGGGGELDLVAYRTARGRRRRFASLFPGEPSPMVADVRRPAGPAGASVCTDRSDAVVGSLSSSVRDGRLTVGLGRSGRPLLGTRCAGPLDVDLAAALPTATVSVRSVLRGHAVLDLSGTRAFAAHGFAGTVRSSLVLALGRASRSGPQGSGVGPTGGQRMRLVTVAYRMERLRGSALAQVHASRDPATCGPLGACGLYGTIHVTAGSPRGGQIYLTAEGPARRPYRDFLAALGLTGQGDRAGIDVRGAGQQLLHGAVSADLHQAGECRDTTRLSSAGISLRVQAGRVHVAFAPLVSQAADALRTRCPGPAISEHQPARGTVPLSSLRRPTFTVALSRSAFEDRAYRVRTTSTLVLTLRRTRITAQTYAMPTPPAQTASRRPRG